MENNHSIDSAFERCTPEPIENSHSKFSSEFDESQAPLALLGKELHNCAKRPTFEH